jgi:hypothetical protein
LSETLPSVSKLALVTFLSLEFAGRSVLVSSPLPVPNLPVCTKGFDYPECLGGGSNVLTKDLRMEKNTLKDN